MEAKEIKKETKKEDMKKVSHSYLKDKHREKVKGIFKFYEVPGGMLNFCFKEFKDEPIERYDLVDGQVYTIPLGVAKHLNKNGWYPEYGFIQGEKDLVGAFNHLTGHTMKVTRKTHRFGFQSLEFIDIEDLGHAAPANELLQVSLG